MRLPRLLLALLGLLSGAVAGFSGARAWNLSRMPFNDAGRFFDSASGVVYHRGSALGWSVVAAGALVIFILVVVGWRQSRSNQSSISASTP